MTDQEINIKIAEYMGLDCNLCQNTDAQGMGGCFNDVKDCPAFIPPDYCHDLNKVWEVEEKLIKDFLDSAYAIALDCNVTALGRGRWVKLIHATARQRCEAIIKVLEGEK
ncbi:MAG: hypothetical protein WC401_10395 [Bacteroidales bacterium]